MVIVAVTAFAQAPAKPELPFPQPEELVYLAEFNRTLLRGVNVGELRFSAKPSASAEKGAWDISGDATAKGFLLKLFGARYHLHIDSIITADSFTVLRNTKVEEDRGRVRSTEGVFDHATRKVTWTQYDGDQSKPGGRRSSDFT